MHLVNVATSLLLIFGFKGVNLAPFGLAQNAFAVPRWVSSARAWARQ